MKTCSRCKEPKSLSAFSRDSRKKDRLQGNCKACAIEVTRLWQAQNPEKLAKHSRHYKENNMFKTRIQNAVNARIRAGRIPKGNACQKCFKRGVRLHAHHSDYFKPYTVRWLCVQCHKNWHSQYGPAPNGQSQQINSNYPAQEQLQLPIKDRD